MKTEIVSIEGLRLTSVQQKAMWFLTEYSKQMVVMAFVGNTIPASVSDLVKEIYQVCDTAIAGCLSRGTKLSCKKGCSWCCFLRVKVTPLEVLCILEYLQSSMPPGELSALRRQFVETDEIIRGLDGHRRVRAKKICPLIVDNECSVYPVRPMSCRIYHSLNASDCEASLEDDRRSLRIRHDVYGVGTGMFAGLTEGLRKVGLQPRLLELVAGLRIAMDEPGLMMRWLAGAPAFAEAEIENAEQIENFHGRLVEKLGNPPM